MVDINLHKVAEKELKIKNSKSILKSSSFISLGILFVTSVIFGGTVLYQVSLEKTKSNLIETREQELSSIDSIAANELVDFQERVDATMDNLEKKNNPKEVLDSLEKLVVKGVFLDKFVQDGDNNKIEIDAVSDSFKIAASQMLSLKKSDMFSDVRIVNSGRNDNGKVVFSLEADLK